MAPLKKNQENAASAPDAFTLGTMVSLRADPSRAGPIIGELPTVGGRRRFKVFHSPTSIKDYFEDQLLIVEPTAEPDWGSLVASGEFVGPAEFRACLAAVRLDNPQTDSIYSLRSARIQFIPFQFKPLLRLLRADRPRLLIADDVGVGKTIEAGLILKELSTRQALARVLVVCPKALTAKWRAEMRRFDENFRILDAPTLRYCLNETHVEGEWPAEYSRAIVHYELFRMEQYLTGSGDRRRRHGFLELEPPPRFDLVIADEAHHLRTPGTGSHQLIERLCLTSEAVLMLSATPVQVSQDNLYALLHLLRPELFQDREVFREVLEPNRYLTAASRMLRAGPAAGEDWLRTAAGCVEEAGRTSWGGKVLRADPRFQDVLSMLASDCLGDEGRVRSIRDLEELHSLAHIMNRTRRRDIGSFTIREPQTVLVEFTPEQRRLYEAVLTFHRQVLLRRHDEQVVRLIMDTLERQAESSINALAGTVREIVTSGVLSVANLTDDPDLDATEPIPSPIIEEAGELLRAAADLPDQDPKFDRLLDTVSATVADPGSPGKILVFSYFLDTIDYLRRRLAEAGVRVGAVTGRISDDEREELRDRFRFAREDPIAIDVLLSSEVGCEGLDYEFCDRLVNYDIPWNPMRVEQRIGRIDRFGQRSDKVLIFNFITPGTVAERVFYRCFDRLGVFRDTVGDLEEVLGEITENLTRIALDPFLSAEQAAERARQIADNAIRRADEQRRLDEESGSLLGLDDAFTEDIEEVMRGGRFVDESDLRVLVDMFLKLPAIRSSLVRQDQSQVYRLRVSDHGRRELVSRVRAAGRLGSLMTSFTRAIEDTGERLLTFDQRTATERREIDFVTPVHPLARAATEYWARADAPLVGGFRIATNLVPAGLYIFTCELWETIAVRHDLRLVCLAVSAETGKFAADLSAEFPALLRTAQSLSAEDMPPIGSHLESLDGISDARRRDLKLSSEESNEQLVGRKLASLQSFHDNRVNRLNADLADVGDPRILRMKRSELASVQRNFDDRKAELEKARQIDVISHRVAAGILEVTR